eukprot:scaffold17198_cov72-Skeletonema_dohrnii-CCMP3373.AAC.1
MEEVVAAASDDPTNPSALFRKYSKINSKCFGFRSINTASPAYSKLASARRTCSWSTLFCEMVERSVWNFFPPTSSVITLSPGPCRWIVCVALLVVVATVEDDCFLKKELFVGFENSTAMR